MGLGSGELSTSLYEGILAIFSSTDKLIYVICEFIVIPGNNNFFLFFFKCYYFINDLQTILYQKTDRSMSIKSSLGKLIYTCSALLSFQHGIGAYVSEKGIQAAKRIKYFIRPRGKLARIRRTIRRTIRSKLYYPSESITYAYISSVILPIKTVVGNRPIISCRHVADRISVMTKYQKPFI